MSLKEKVKELIDSALSESESLFLIDFTVSADNSVKVVIDGDNGVGIDDCIAVSRAVEHNLDREEEDFSIEVTSFGALTPFHLERQYRKNVGRQVELLFMNDKRAEGILKSVSAGVVTLETTERVPKPTGKGKMTVTQEQQFPLSECKEAKVIIKF
ncbi:MAG: ribosome assembly cofactor RimP [Capnocytophaga sp.]|nr:ribosome assembly cofactor RimP [Capnocytophaga sp.]